MRDVPLFSIVLMMGMIACEGRRDFGGEGGGLPAEESVKGTS